MFLNNKKNVKKLTKNAKKCEKNAVFWHFFNDFFIKILRIFAFFCCFLSKNDKKTRLEHDGEHDQVRGEHDWNTMENTIVNR